MNRKAASLFLLLALFGFVGPALTALGQEPPTGGMNVEEGEERRPSFSNQPYPVIVPEALDPGTTPTYSDPGSSLVVFIDPEHGYLRGLAFPGLYAEALVQSVDQYIVHQGAKSSEFDDRVKCIRVDTESDPKQIVVDCVNESLGLDITKRYSLHTRSHEVVKTVEIFSTTQQLLCIQSVSVLSELMRKGGYYYQYLAHTANRYCAYPAASIGEAYFPNRRNFQSAVMTVTRPDVDFTYGEVPLTMNGVPIYMCLESEDESIVEGKIETLLTKDGWQLPRVPWLLVGPARGRQAVSWMYTAVRGTHLMWHDQYDERHFFPGFAPERPLDRGIDLAYDASFLWQSSAASYGDGDLKIREGGMETAAFGEFEDFHSLFEGAGLGPRAWATCGLSERAFTMGDYLSDNIWYGNLDQFDENDQRIGIYKIPMKNYLAFARSVQRRLPRFHLFNYERGGYYPHVETIQKHPELGFFPPYNKYAAVGPYYTSYFDLMARKYLEFQEHGISLYVDWALPSSRFGTREDGSFGFEGYDEGQRAVRKTARAMRDAGGMFYVNQPSGPWADLGYFEGGRWDTETQDDWRYVAERLQLYKLHEFRPNTVVALDMMCVEFFHQCLMYNFQPNINNRVSLVTKQSLAPRELIRLRWPLREAVMAPVPLRPVWWETPGSPLETAVLTVPGTVQLAAFNHVPGAGHTADLSVDLGPVLARKPYAVWRSEVVEAPWVNIECKQGEEPHVKLAPGQWKNLYHDMAGKVAIKRYEDTEWDGLKLTLPGVEIPGQSTLFFHLSLVPAVVRSVEGRDVHWPLSSQPHLRIEQRDDGTLLFSSEYTEATVAVSPDWLSDDAPPGGIDELTGWPTVTIPPGTWRLTADARLLYENPPN